METNQKVTQVTPYAVLLFVVVLILEGITGLPLRDWILTCMIYIAVSLAGACSVVLLLSFLLLVFHVLMPFKDLRRQVLIWFKEKFLINENRLYTFKAIASTFYIFGGVVFVIGASLLVGIGFKVREHLNAIMGGAVADLVVMFSSFFFQVSLGIFAYLIYASSETKRLKEILSRN